MYDKINIHPDMKFIGYLESLTTDGDLAPFVLFVWLHSIPGDHQVGTEPGHQIIQRQQLYQYGTNKIEYHPC